MFRISRSVLALAGIGALVATPALAQEVPEHGVFVLNSLLFLIGGVLVMFMACGFCMLETGLVRSKNTTMQLTKNVALFSVAAIGYYLIGYNLMYPARNVVNRRYPFRCDRDRRNGSGRHRARRDRRSCLRVYGFRLFFPVDVLRGDRIDRFWNFG